MTDAPDNPAKLGLAREMSAASLGRREIGFAGCLIGAMRPYQWSPLGIGR